MSLINSMLQDLDRRQALGADAEVAAVRAPGAKPRREWFWGVLAVLMSISVAWVGWVAYQVMPRPIATKLALKAEQDRLARPIRVAEPAPAPAPEPEREPALSVVTTGPAVFETFKLATEITTPVRESSPKAVRTTKGEPVRAKAEPVKAKAEPVRARAVPVAAVAAKPPPKGTVDKFERTAAGSSAAASDFRRAVALLNHGRVAEAQELLAKVLKTEPAHATARQVYVALLLEHGRVESARRVLEEGLAVAPGHADFALALARIHTAQRSYDAAWAVLEKVAPEASGDVNFQAMRGAVLQRLGRHSEAAEAYQAAVRGAPQQATNWLGLAISYEALGRAAEAAEAYRRSLSAGPLAPQARDYAETRMRALR